jgi:hypothetical protein
VRVAYVSPEGGVGVRAVAIRSSLSRIREMSSIAVKRLSTFDSGATSSSIGSSIGSSTGASPAESSQHNAWNAATGSTPFFLNVGENPQSPVSADIYCKLPAAKSFEERVNEAVARARNCFSAAQARMKENADLKRRALEFKVGDRVPKI